VSLARWKDLCIDASDAPRAARFWAGVLGLAASSDDDGDAVLRGDHADRTVWVNRVPEPKTVKNRVHLDLVLPSYAPLVEAGARVVEDHHTTRYRWTVLADPEGNELCVFPEGQQAPTALVVDAVDPVSVAAWWADVLGARPVEAPDGVLRWLDDVTGLPYDVWKFVPVTDAKTVKNRWHWDLTCDDVDGLVARGATVLRKPDGAAQWHVLADPEGNEFCVFAP
jgi:catechol 2,3-dioxygenase-like lactoylglutathione lyase family enzyme